MTPCTDSVGELDTMLDRALWHVQEGELDGDDVLELLDDYRDRIAAEVDR